MHKLTSLLAATSGLLMAASVQAASIRFESRDVDAPIVTTSSPTNYATGVLHYSINPLEGGGSFDAWCVEPEQSIAIRALGYQTYTTGAFSSTQNDLLQGLFSSSYAGLSGGQQKAAFQYAIWELLRENTGSLSATSGSFYIRSGVSATADANAPAIASLANGFLASAQTYSGPALYSFTKLSNGVYQDLVVATAVPEPETYALFLGGLGVIGLVARRRLPR